MEILNALGSKTNCFYKSCTYFLCLHVSEVCPAKWLSLSCNVCWDSNEVNPEEEFVTDWMGRCLEKTTVKPLHDIPIEGLMKKKRPYSAFTKSNYIVSTSPITWTGLTFQSVHFKSAPKDLSFLIQITTWKYYLKWEYCTCQWAEEPQNTVRRYIEHYFCNW